MFLEQFEKISVERADHAAVIALSEGRALTFRQLRAEFLATADELERARLPERARVVAQTGNRPAFLSLFLASLKLDLVLIPIDADSAPAELEAVAERYQAAAVVTHGAFPRARGSRALPGEVKLHRVREEAPSAPLDGVFLLKLTSGSTGLPKAVRVSEEELWNDGRHIVEAMGIGPADVNLGLIPLSHSYGLGNLTVPLFLQGTPVALRNGFAPALFVHDVEQTGATVFPGVPFMFQHFRRQEFRGPLPRSLRLLVTAGARIEGETVEYFKDRLRIKIHSFYGSSECGGICYDASEEVLDPITLGRSMPETTVSLRHGRVFVRGNAVSRGYLESSAGEAEPAFLEGGFLTSDLGHFDEGGRLYLTGRVSSVVNVAGRKVNPAEIEAVLLQMPEIAEARVLGVPCERRGQKLLACVVPRRRDLSPLAIRRHCATKLSPHKIPHDFLLLEAWPVDARGKLDRVALESLSSQTGQQPPGERARPAIPTD